MRFTGNMRSILAMLLAVVFFSCMDAILKVLAGAYPPLQVTALRGLTAVPWVLGYVLWRRQLGLVFSRHLRWRLHLLRGLIGVLMMALFIFGLQTLGLAEAYTLSFVAPLLITLLAVPVLQEAALPRHWVALAVGLCGVVIALRPDQDAFFNLGSVAVLASAVCYALSTVLGRLISRTEPSVTLVFWTTFSMTVGGSVLGAADWVEIRAVHWPVLLGLGVTGTLAQLCVTEAFRHGQASAIAPFEYSALIWAVAFDWLIWRAVPDAYTLTGGAVIIASGLYLIRREAPRGVVVLPP